MAAGIAATEPFWLLLREGGGKPGFPRAPSESPD